MFLACKICPWEYLKTAGNFSGTRFLPDNHIIQIRQCRPKPNINRIVLLRYRLQKIRPEWNY